MDGCYVWTNDVLFRWAANEMDSVANCESLEAEEGSFLFPVEVINVVRALNKYLNFLSIEEGGGGGWQWQWQTGMHGTVGYVQDSREERKQVKRFLMTTTHFNQRE